jgi:pimeloyl-ACP methyl ester carboxylesterase
MGFTKKLFQIGLFIGGTLGLMAAYNKIAATMAGELDTALPGTEERYPWKYGDMFYTVNGSPDAPPLLLVHSFSPGASSYEWRKNVEALGKQFRVYALDLLGFGLSDRPDIEYTPEIYSDLLHDFLKEVIKQPATVVTHGLTAAYAIACAFRRPQLFERLVLVTPPVEILQERFPDPLSSALRVLLRLPIVGEFIYNVLTSRPGIRRFYDRFGYHNLLLLSENEVEYLYTSAHQPNSYYPSAAFLSGGLLLNVQEPLARLKMPVFALWGREGDYDRAEAAFTQVNPNVEVGILDRSNFHLQEEQATRFNGFLLDLAPATKQS